MKSFPHLVSQRFDHAADTYDQHSVIQRQSADILLNQIQAHIQPNHILLDAGCGTGYLTQALAAQGCRVWAVDLAPQMLQHLDHLDHPNQVQTICADMAALPLPSEMLDGLVSNFSAHWLGASVLCEWLRVVRPAGDVWLAIPVAGSLDELTARYAGFQTFAFQSKQDWLDAARPWLQTSWTQRISQTFPNLQSLMRNLRAMGGNQLGNTAPKTPLSQTKQQWQAWYAQDMQAPAPIDLSYQVLFLHLKK